VPPSPAMSEFERSARRRERHRVVACLHTGPGRAALMVAVAALVARQLAQTVVAGCRTTGVLASSVGSRPPSRHGARMAGDHMIAGRRRRSPPRSSAGCGAARSATGADSLSPCHPAPDAQRILRLHATGWERLGRRGHRRGPRHQCRRRPSPAPARPAVGRDGTGCPVRLRRTNAAAGAVGCRPGVTARRAKGAAVSGRVRTHGYHTQVDTAAGSGGRRSWLPLMAVGRPDRGLNYPQRRLKW
jgi:hypothetical protein